MRLFGKNKKETVIETCQKEVIRDYPTIEEYFAEIKRIQTKELNSDRYKKILTHLEKHYWNRNNKDLEAELFKIVENYGSINKPNEYQKKLRLKKYVRLKKFLKGLSEEKINSNEFLKLADLYIKTSVKECEKIVNELNKKIENKDHTKCFKIEVSISEVTQKHLPKFVDTTCSILFYNPNLYKREYIDILDSFHINVYKDYNAYVDKVKKLAEDIYLLELNYQLVKKFNNITCFHFQIYNPNYNTDNNKNKFIASFSLYKEKKSINKNEPIVEENFIETTINNFQKLIDLGIVEITSLEEEKGISYVLKRK